MHFARMFTAALLFGAVSLSIAGEIKPYDQKTFDALSGAGKPVMLAIHATWCPTCKAQKPIIKSLMDNKAYREVTTLMIDFDTDKPLLQKYRVATQSTLVAFKGKTEVGRSVADTSTAGIEGLVRKTL